MIHTYKFPIIKNIYICVCVSNQSKSPGCESKPRRFAEIDGIMEVDSPNLWVLIHDFRGVWHFEEIKGLFRLKNSTATRDHKGCKLGN